MLINHNKSPTIFVLNKSVFKIRNIEISNINDMMSKLRVTLDMHRKPNLYMPLIRQAGWPELHPEQGRTRLQHNS